MVTGSRTGTTCHTGPAGVMSCEGWERVVRNFVAPALHRTHQHPRTVRWVWRFGCLHKRRRVSHAAWAVRALSIVLAHQDVVEVGLRYTDDEKDFPTTTRQQQQLHRQLRSRVSWYFFTKIISLIICLKNYDDTAARLQYQAIFKMRGDGLPSRGRDRAADARCECVSKLST